MASEASFLKFIAKGSAIKQLLKPKLQSQSGYISKVERERLLSYIAELELRLWQEFEKHATHETTPESEEDEVLSTLSSVLEAQR